MYDSSCSLCCSGGCFLLNFISSFRFGGLGFKDIVDNERLSDGLGLAIPVVECGMWNVKKCDECEM